MAKPDSTIVVDPTERFDISPYLTMQFMEPLGTTDGSVEAAWDFNADGWREDVIAAAIELNVPMVRWGGCYSSYYKWREGIGPRNERPIMYNTLWGGTESNRIGTHEFLDFCHRVGAQALICVNFGSDGEEKWMRHPIGGDRVGTAREAAEWVDYCNDPSNRERIRNGTRDPFNIRHWQIGNETSYVRNGWSCREAAARTVDFAQAMRSADPGIELVGWGDTGWARAMYERTEGRLDYLAFHCFFGSALADSPLKDADYRRDFPATWEHLMSASATVEEKIVRVRQELSGCNVRGAITECHFSLRGRNRCEVLSTWAAGVANARILNVFARNADFLGIANLGDFLGTRWQVNCLMIPTPLRSGQNTYPMPVAHATALFSSHIGKRSLHVKTRDPYLDVTASRTDNTVYLYVINTNCDNTLSASIEIPGSCIPSVRVFQITADPQEEIMETRTDIFAVEKLSIAGNTVEFPAASVSAVELEIGREHSDG